VMGPRPVLDDRYELGETLGRGGMAVVRRARDLRLGREVAVKLLYPEVAMDPEAMAAFRAEAMSSARLNHPGVVAVHDVGEALIDGVPRPYLVMEMIEGQPLSHLLVDGTPLTVERALEIGVDVTSALAHAHERGLVHRDVTPGNLMVLRDGSVKVTDFGIARAMPGAPLLDSDEWTDELAEAGQGFGSIAYLSPEQARRGFVDARSDLYSVGCLLMTMLTGYPPFRGSPKDVLRHHLRTLPPAPSSRRPGLPPALDDIVGRALEKDPWARPQSAAEMRRDLLQVLSEVDAPAAWAAGAHGLATAVAPHEPQRAGGTTDVATEAVGTGMLPDDDEPVGGHVGGAALVRDAGAGGPSGASTTEHDASAAAAGAAAGALAAGGAAAGPPAGPGTVGRLRHVAARIGRSRRAALTLAAVLAVALVVSVVAMWPGQDPDSALAQTGAPVTVPRTAGLTVEVASERLAEVGLTVGESSTLPSVDVPRGAVLGTDPPAGEQAPSGSTVEMIISSGPDSTAVPTLVGELVSAARQRLEESGLVVGDVLEVPSTSPRGTVLETDPGFGEVRPEGTVVDLIVASGSNLVPPVVGLQQGEAVAQVTGAGFVVQIEERESDEDGGLVLEVQPDASTDHRLGTTVTLVVAATTDSAPVRVTQTAFSTTTATTRATATATATATTTVRSTATATSTVRVTSTATVTSTTTVTEPPAPDEP
jgi:eukaryotic-like serine/threonine-protein kinase